VDRHRFSAAAAGIHSLVLLGTEDQPGVAGSGEGYARRRWG
jgi:hypothetical protein